MKKIALPVLFSVIIFSGCYDMTDIENIKTVSAACVEPGKITYCTVTTTPGEKSYGFELYPVETEDLYEGLNSISLKTGKEISVSHLNALIFKKDCPVSLISTVCTSAINGSEIHPKVMAAFVDMEFDDFFDKMLLPGDTVMYKKISDVFRDRYAAVTQCTVTELYHGLKHESLGVNMPVFSLDAEGNIVSDGIGHVNVRDTGFFDRSIADTVCLLKNSGKPVYYNTGANSVAVKLVGGGVDFDRERNYISISLEVGVSGGGKPVSENTLRALEERISSDVIKICNQKNTGFDILNLNREMLRSFVSERDFTRYCSSKGGFYSMLTALEYDVHILAEEGDV